MPEGSGVIQGVSRITDGRHRKKYFPVTRSDKEDQKMHMISRLGFASLALGFAVLVAPAARADGSDGTGLQAVAEMMRQAQQHIAAAGRLLKDAARLKLEQRRARRKSKREK